jgi:DNA repair exonuclease SbcCD ATPase subunit
MKLRFKRLEADKAFTYKHLEADLENQGTVLVMGLNLDSDKPGSNGAGKSAIWEILGHTCFAVTGRGLRKSEILTAWSPTDYLSKLSFSRDDTELSVHQFREHSKLGTGVQIWQGSTNLTEGMHSNKAQEEVAKQLGLTEDEFFGVVYLHQDAQHILVGGTPTERKTFLTTVFPQLQIFTDLQDFIGKRPTTKLAVSLLTIEAQLKDIEDQLAAPEFLKLDESINNVSASREAGQAKLQIAREVADKAIRLSETAKQGQTARTAWDDYIRVYNLPATAERKISERLSHVSYEAHRLDTERQELERCLLVRTQRLSLEAWLAAHPLPLVSDPKARLNELAAERAKWEDCSRTADRVQLLQAARAKLNAELSSSEVQSLIDTTQQTIVNASADSVRARKIIEALAALNAPKCPVCSKPLTEEEAKSLVQEAESTAQRNTKLLSLSDQELKTLKQMQKEIEEAIRLEGEIATLLPNIANVTSDESRAHLARIQQETKEAQELIGIAAQTLDKQTMLARLETIAEDIDARKEENLRLLQEAQAHQIVLQKLVAVEAFLDAPELAVTLSQEEEASQQYKQLLAEDKRLEQELGVLRELRAKLTYLQERKKEKIQECASARAIANTDTCYKYLKLSYGHMRDAQCTEVMQSLKQVLPAYTDLFFASKELKITVSEEAGLPALVMERQGLMMDPQKLSGGQRKRISISALLAISDIKRGSKQVNLQIFDEVFSALDAPGREAAIYILQERRATCETVVVVTHEQEVLGAQWDQVWWAVLKNNVSQLLRLNTTDPREVIRHVG